MEDVTSDWATDYTIFTVFVKPPQDLAYDAHVMAAHPLVPQPHHLFGLKIKQEVLSISFKLDATSNMLSRYWLFQEYFTITTRDS